VGVALAWQWVFLIIAKDPERFRPLMPAAVLEKLAFGLAAVVLFAQQRVAGAVLALGCVDLMWAGALCGGLEANTKNRRRAGARDPRRPVKNVP
jgi:hypothetical protein